MSAPGLRPEVQARVKLDLAAALVIRARLNGTPADRQDAETLLGVLTAPASPVAAEAGELPAELERKG